MRQETPRSRTPDLPLRTARRGRNVACALFTAFLLSPSAGAAYEVYVEHNRCPDNSRLWVHWKDRDGRWQTRHWAIDDGADGTRLTYDGGKAVDTANDRVFLDFDVPPSHQVTIHDNSPKVWGDYRKVGDREFMAYADRGWFSFNLKFHCERLETEAEARTCDLADELHARLTHVKCEQRASGSAATGTPTGELLADGIRRSTFERCVHDEMRRGPRHPTLGSLFSGRCDALVRSLKNELAARGEPYAESAP
ncbi:MAG: hypothetical protein OXQ90_19245 [Gammaproteobacteria bacterium]|nr:hypothetical protein [Gammaproteobacteria bacterium]